MISGLTYIPNATSTNTAHHLIKTIDSHIWRIGLKRRVQHYGYIYDYKRRTVDKNMYLGELPLWSQPLLDLLQKREEFAIRADQMIVNEYQPGQGIAPHIDCEPCFGNVIASLSLNSICIMSFIHRTNNQKVDIWLKPNSLLIMRGEARYDWKHGIPARKTDKYLGTTYTRQRRISITFRKVILSS